VIERGRWRVWLSEEAEAIITDSGRAAHPRETGGVLIGVLAGSRPWVTDAVHVPSRHSTGNTYEIPAGARRRAVEKARQKDPRVGYLGDWHSHPADVGPSQCDQTTMASIAADARAGCSRPLLLVLRRAQAEYAIDARQWTGGALRVLRVVRAGALAPDGPRRPRRRLPRIPKPKLRRR
jgi:proteasome lid subunit RPN8/RPN11